MGGWKWFPAIPRQYRVIGVEMVANRKIDLFHRGTRALQQPLIYSEVTQSVM